MSHDDATIINTADARSGTMMRVDVKTGRGASGSRGRTTMGIETLQKAAAAAGFAMATPDDDPPIDVASEPATDVVHRTGQWLVPVQNEAAPRFAARESVAAAAAWIRNHLPMMGGGRAPA